MSKRHSLDRLCIVLCLALFATSGNVESQPQPSSANAQILRALRRLGALPLPFDRHRPTVVFTTSMEQCTGCCASAVNGILSALDRVKWSVNVLVLVGTDQPRELAAIRHLFKSPNLVASTGEDLWRDLGASSSVPSMMVLDPDGEVRVRVEDIQHRHVDAPAMNAIRWRVQIPVETKPAWDVALAESKEDVVVDAYSPSMRGDLITFTDPRAGVVYSCSVRDGVIRSRLPVPDSLARRFQSAADNPAHWQALFDNISQIVQPYAAVRRGGDTTLVVATFHTGYDSTRQPDGRTMILFRKQECIVLTRGGRFESIHAFKRTDGSIVPPYAFDSAGSAIGGYEWYGAGDDPTSDARRDSGFVLASMRISDAGYRPLLPIRKLEAAIGVAVDPVLSVIPSAGPDGDVVFYDVSNDLLCRYVERDGVPVVTPLWNSAVAVGLVPASKPELLPKALKAPIIHEPAEHPRELDDRTVLGVATDGVHVDVVALQTVDEHDVPTVRRAAADGTILAETAIRRNRDEAQLVYPVGYRDGNLILFIKWKRARWRITAVKLPG